MSALAIASMTVIATLVWGGFVFLLVRALRRESRKREVSGPG